jgi:hypothetical protein
MIYLPTTQTTFLGHCFRQVISCGNRGVSFNGNISSTSKHEDLQVPVIAKSSFDDDFPDVDFNEIVSDIENFENRNLVHNLSSFHF